MVIYCDDGNMVQQISYQDQLREGCGAWSRFGLAQLVVYDNCMTRDEGFDAWSIWDGA